MSDHGHGVEIAFIIIALAIISTNASSSSFRRMDAASNHDYRLASFAFPPNMIPMRVFAPLYVSRKDRYSRTIFNRSPDDSSMGNNNRRWEDDARPFSVGKPRGDDDYDGRTHRPTPDVTTMTTSSTGGDYDLYDRQMREEGRRDYREGRINQSREWSQNQEFDYRDDYNDVGSLEGGVGSGIEDGYYNNRPYLDRDSSYDFDMRQQQQYDDGYAQIRKSRYPRRGPPLSQLIRRKNEASPSSSRIVGELYTDNFRRDGGSNSEKFRRGPIRDRSGREYDVDLDDEEDYYDYTSYNGRGDADGSRSSSYDRWDQSGQQSDRSTSFRGSRWQDTDDFMRTGGDSRSPGQLVNSGREIAFNRSRSGLIRDSSNKKNLNRWQRDDASSSSLISSSAFSVGRRGVDETDFRRRGKQQLQQYGRDIAFDRNRPQQYGTNNDMSIGDNYYKERQDQLFETKSTTFGQIRRVPTPPSQSRHQQQNSLNRLQMDSDNDMIRNEQLQQQKSETVQQRRRKNDRLVTTRQDKKPLVKQMMDGFTDLFTDKTSTSSSTSNTSEEERVTRVLLSDARRCLLADPVIRDALGGGGRGGGENITLGKIYSRSYTSTMVNGQTRSRVQLTFPIYVGNSSSRSSRDEGGITGQGTVIANQDGITRLQVHVDGRIVDVPCNR